MRKFLLPILFATSLFGAKYLAVLDLEAESISESEAKILTQRLTSIIIELSDYSVVERANINKILNEQKFQHSGCTDSECAVEIGQLLNTDFIIIGYVSKFGSIWVIDSRLIDVAQGNVLISAEFSMEGDIDVLITSGIPSIAQQLSEVPIQSTTTITSVDDIIREAPVKAKTPTTDFIAYKDDSIPTKKSSLVLSDYYYKGHELELSDNTTIYGNYLGTNSGLVLFISAGYVKNVHCNRVVNIYDGVGDEIDYDCTEDTFFPEQ